MTIIHKPWGKFLSIPGENISAGEVFDAHFIHRCLNLVSNVDPHSISCGEGKEFARVGVKNTE